MRFVFAIFRLVFQRCNIIPTITDCNVALNDRMEKLEFQEVANRKLNDRFEKPDHQHRCTDVSFSASTG
jgi:hypothetical protein